MLVNLIVFIIVVLIIVFLFRRFSSFVYAVCSLDILYRLLHFLVSNIHVKELSNLVNKYIPESVVSMISKYTGTGGLLYTLVIWFMFLMYACLLFYIVRILIKRK
ncbi:MAG: hypothetical protein IKE10_01105 [Bacilli bacterium]|nr:hypothetical protein [Bacilli bacterium]